MANRNNNTPDNRNNNIGFRVAAHVLPKLVRPAGNALDYHEVMQAEA